MSHPTFSYGILGISILLLFFLHLSPPATAMDDPWDWNNSKKNIDKTHPSPIETNTLRLVANTAILVFQKHVSPADGPRCKFHPSCSQYCKNAINRHGAVMGTIMFADRFMRDHGWVTGNYPVIWTNGQQLYFDPVFMNDFWWYDQAD